MAATEVRPAVPKPIRRGDSVVATRDLADGVRAGDRGRVMVVNGFEWTRYWVRFEGGQVLNWLGDDDVQPARRGLFR